MFRSIVQRWNKVWSWRCLGNTWKSPSKSAYRISRTERFLKYHKVKNWVGNIQLHPNFRTEWKSLTSASAVKCVFRLFRLFPLAFYLICEKVNLRSSLVEFDVTVDKSEILVGVWTFEMESCQVLFLFAGYNSESLMGMFSQHFPFPSLDLSYRWPSLNREWWAFLSKSSAHANWAYACIKKLF
jgi:hypothetical protein